MKAIIFGGGKIARGFVAHLLYLSRAEFAFVDVNADLVALFNQRKQYHVHIMGAEERSADITGYEAFHLSDVQGIARYWAGADMAFTSVGGKNLKALAKIIADAFVMRCRLSPLARPFNIVTCENWKNPAKLLNEEILAHLPSEYADLFRQWVGISEAVVMRSAVEPDPILVEKDPLCVKVQNFWQLPIDRERIKGEPLPIEGVSYIDHFAGFLEQKFYTNNTSNATVSYLGYLKGYEYVSDAANDADIEEILDSALREINGALSSEHGIPIEKQIEFSQKAKRKYQDETIVDYIERHARDPVRKLGPEDRLVGAAKLVIRYGAIPHGIATAIAAALYYDHPEDSIARQLKEKREQDGYEGVLHEICKLNPDESLFLLVKEKVDVLREKGWIR